MSTGASAFAVCKMSLMITFLCREVIRRRFTRGLKEQEEGEDGKFARFPDLVVIDGGKGQLNAAIAVRDELGLDIPFIGLAERLEEVFVEGQSDPVNLPRNTKGSLLLQRIRDEAHRFALTYHRNLRGKASRRSILDDVPGIGPKRKSTTAPFWYCESYSSGKR